MWHRLDVRDSSAVEALLDAERPDVVVHTAYRQDDPEVTADGTAHVAAAAARAGAFLVHVSSDVVFSGEKSPYAEDAPREPVSAYGAAKARAEEAVEELAPGAALARTSLVLGPGSPMETRVLDLLQGRLDGELFTDDVRCPVHVSDLAAALLELAVDRRGGVWHLAGPDALSRLEIGGLVAAREGLDPAVLRPGSRRAAGIPGPLDLRLDCARSRARLSTRLRGAREFLLSS